MSRRLSNEKFRELAENKFPGQFLYERMDYTGKRNDVVITCKVHGDFKVNAWTFIRSSTGCLLCGSDLAKTTFLEKSKMAHGDKYRYHHVKYVNTTTKVEVECPKHGLFWTVPWLHYDRGVGCMDCFKERNRLNVDTFIARSEKLHSGKYDYREVEYVSHTTPVKIHCPTHGPFTQEPRVHLSGSGCSDCSSEQSRSNTEEFIRKGREIHGERYNYDRVVYKTSKEKVEIVCLKHGPFWVKPNGHLASTNGCPRCKESTGETRIRTFLEKSGLEFVQEYRIEPYKYRYDFYLPGHNLLIEFHGKQHYVPVLIFGGLDYFNQTVENDQRKIEIAKDAGLHLTVIDYHKLKDSRLERLLTKVLQYRGHVFSNE